MQLSWRSRPRDGEPDQPPGSKVDHIAICKNNERAVASAGSPLSIPEFLSTEQAIDIRLLFGPSSIASGHTHSSVEAPGRAALDAMITQQALRRADVASGV
jgi:hypothetical protein